MPNQPLGFNDTEYVRTSMSTENNPNQPQQPVMPPNPEGNQPVAPPAPDQQPVHAPSNGKAVGALACGILAILFAWMPLLGVALGVAAIVLAGKAVRESGKDGKATGGKACGIIGIVLAVLSLVLYLVLFSFGTMAYLMAGSTSTEYLSSLSTGDARANEADMETVAAAEYDRLKNKDAALIQQIAASVDKSFASAAHYGLADLGLDPQTFAEWMLTDFDYSLDGAYDNGDGTGTVYANVTVRDATAFANAFVADAQAALDSGQLDGLDEAAMKAKLGEIYASSMAKSTGTTTSYSGISLVQQGDVWKVDQDAWNIELKRLLGLYY